MAGHSKWHNIKHRKAAQDAKKSKYYARIGKIIQIAAKDGADPSMNPKLQLALQKAKQYNLPKDVVKKAIDKGSGSSASQAIQEVLYEGYGPGGVPLLIQSLTDNPTRTTQIVRALLTKYGGSLGTPGSVVWQFTHIGECFVDGIVQYTVEKGVEKEIILPLPIDDFEEWIIGTLADNVYFDDGVARVVCSKEAFTLVRDALLGAHWHVIEDDLVYIPNTPLNPDSSTLQKLETLIGLLEEEDDVDAVWHAVIEA